jgi:hypothetical protein
LLNASLTKLKLTVINYPAYNNKCSTHNKMSTLYTLKVMIIKTNYRFVAWYLSLTLIALTALSCTYNEATEVAPLMGSVSYKEDIVPIMSSHCYSCHTASSTDPNKAGYAYIDNYEELKRYALRPSTTNASLTKLQARIRFVETPGMPLKQAPMPENDIIKIEAWIKAGAPNN